MIANLVGPPHNLRLHEIGELTPRVIRDVYGFPRDAEGRVIPEYLSVGEGERVTQREAFTLYCKLKGVYRADWIAQLWEEHKRASPSSGD